jgi:GNAT superfamily N-acetyltransferase
MLMPAAIVRAARQADLAAIAAIATATGQEDDWSATNPAYVGHLMAHGRVVVGELSGQVTGFGAVQQIGTAATAVSMLCDLFVDPEAHGAGLGRAMLAELWRDTERRITFSSQHAHALPLYMSFGVDAWWPLLYLRGDSSTLRVPDGWKATVATAGQVAGLERDWTGTDRTADHRVWAARPNGAAVLAAHDGVVLAAGTAAGPAGDFGLMHLATSPGADDTAAVAGVVTVLASLVSPGPTATVCLPAPHPAVRVLLAAGWRIEDLDLFMASEPDLLDPRRAVPSPGQA